LPGLPSIGAVAHKLLSLSRFAPARIALSPSVVILSEAKNRRAGSAMTRTVNSAKNLATMRINCLRNPSLPSAPQDDTHWAFFGNRREAVLDASQSK
jgi:hypothetical protein